MPGPGIWSVPFLAQAPAAEVFGIPASMWFWLAVAGWMLALLLGVALALRPERRGAPRGVAPRRTEAVDGVPADAPQLLSAIAPDHDPVGGVLRWLAVEAEADAVALLELTPAREEVLRIEPRGLSTVVVARVVALARRALLDPTAVEEIPGVTAARWLGIGGSKVLLGTGTSDGSAEEPFRFSRYLLEWIRSSHLPRGREGEVEERVRAIDGVAWVEAGDGTARILLAEGADRSSAQPEVDQVLERAALTPLWIEAAEPEVPAGGAERRPIAEEEVREVSRQADGAPGLATSALGTHEPRIRLVDVVLSEKGQATADVRVAWSDQEIHGRGHGRATPAGRYFAAAQAVADALRPLLDSEVVVEGLYVASTKEGVDVLMAEVRMEGDRYVGAVLERRDQRDWTGARAVLDAVNRRLAQVAGRSGRV